MSDLKIEGSSLDTDRDLFSDKVLFLRGFIGKATKWLVCTMNPWVESDVNLMSDKKPYTHRGRDAALLKETPPILQIHFPLQLPPKY